MIRKGWFKGIDKKKRYSLGKGRIAAGLKKIGKTYYFLKTKSGRLQKKGFFKSGKKEYYSKGGVRRSGRQDFDRVEYRRWRYV